MPITVVSPPGAGPSEEFFGCRPSHKWDLKPAAVYVIKNVIQAFKRKNS